MIANHVGRVRSGIRHRVECRVAAQIVCRAVDEIRAGFRLKTHNAASAVPELGVHAVLLNIELRNGVHWGHVRRLIGQQLRYAVNQQVIFCAGIASDVQLAGRP